MKKDNFDDYIIDRYIDGEMAAGEAAEFEKRLADSPELRMEVEALRTAGQSLKEAFSDEVEQVDFSKVWSSVEEGVQERKLRFESITQFIVDLFATKRFAVAASAAAVVVLCVAAALIIMYKTAIAPVPSVAAPEMTYVDIDYGDNPDVVITVETLGDSSTTVVYVQDFDLDEDIQAE